jgi:hypothetical protein
MLANLILLAAIVIFLFSLWLGFALGTNYGLERGVKILTDAEVKKQRELTEIRIAEIKTNQANYLDFLDKCKKLGTEIKPDLGVN